MVKSANNTRGTLISLEGIDGSGKTSILKVLHEFLTSHSLNTIQTRQPGGTEFGQKIRSILHYRTFQLCYKAEFLLFAADRAQHINEVIEPALKDNKIIICDRMADSSVAYQGFGRELGPEFVSLVNSWAVNDIKPDIVIYLKIDYETAAKRLTLRNEQATSFEKEKADFFNRIIHGYETIFADRDNVITIDASLPVELVAKNTLDSVIQALRTKFGYAL